MIRTEAKSNKSCRASWRSRGDPRASKSLEVSIWSVVERWTGGLRGRWPNKRTCANHAWLVREVHLCRVEELAQLVASRASSPDSSELVHVIIIIIIITLAQSHRLQCVVWESLSYLRPWNTMSRCITNVVIVNTSFTPYGQRPDHAVGWAASAWDRYARARMHSGVVAPRTRLESELCPIGNCETIIF